MGGLEALAQRISRLLSILIVSDGLLDSEARSAYGFTHLDFSSRKSRSRLSFETCAMVKLEDGSGGLGSHGRVGDLL